MAQSQREITAAEADILKWFRSYGVRPNEMLFVNRSAGKAPSPGFNHAMQSMVERGLVIQEARHRDAYSLSAAGYQASLAFAKA